MLINVLFPIHILQLRLL